MMTTFNNRENGQGGSAEFRAIREAERQGMLAIRRRPRALTLPGMAIRITQHSTTIQNNTTMMLDMGELLLRLNPIAIEAIHRAQSLP
eukprot:2165752-Amphidinium_carterae.4